MGLTRAEEAQAGPCRWPPRRRGAAPARATGVLALGVVLVEAPTAVVALMAHEPVQGAGHGAFRLLGAAVAAQHGRAMAAAAAAEAGAVAAAAGAGAGAHARAHAPLAGHFHPGPPRHDVESGAAGRILGHAGRAAALVLEDLAVVVILLLLLHLARW